MVTSRRGFLARSFAGGATLLAAPPPGRLPGLAAIAGPLLKPPRLHEGDTVGLINPTQSDLGRADLEVATANLQQLGLKVRCGRALAECLDGADVSDAGRAAEVNALFADPSVKALMPLRGGFGSARLLPHLDYALIRHHPKVLVGFSDAVALLLAIQVRTGLVTFHGPMAVSSWAPFGVAQLRRLLFDAEATRMVNPAPPGSGGAAASIRTLAPGRARGRLLGGNLTVLSSMVGSPYLGGVQGSILFLEEVREPLSEVDRMMTQLEQAGILPRIRGLVFGECSRCSAPQINGSLTLDAVLLSHVRALGIPAWRGSRIGHGEGQFTVPLGVDAEIDAGAGSIQLLEPAVS
jgi:muramoyltetrapeptide carboxypeptidase